MGLSNYNAVHGVNDIIRVHFHDETWVYQRNIARPIHQAC